MKSFICTTIAALAFIGAAPEANARGYSRSGQAYHTGYTYSGKPVYTKRYLVGYDHCGRPIFAYRSAPAPTRYCAPPPRCHPRPAYCPPRRHHGGVTVYGSFRL